MHIKFSTKYLIYVNNYAIIKLHLMLKNEQISLQEENNMAISARKIVYSVGMSGRPEFYSGRGATMSDLDGDRLYAIYQKIAQELGTRQADAFVTMVKKLKTLSATNFLNALYALELNDWNLT